MSKATPSRAYASPDRYSEKKGPTPPRCRRERRPRREKVSGLAADPNHRRPVAISKSGINHARPTATPRSLARPGHRKSVRRATCRSAPEHRTELLG